MNKAALCAALAQDLSSTKAGAERALNAVLANIAKGLRRNGEVGLVGFGTFRVRQVKPRSIRNPRTGAKIRTKAGRTVKFKAGKALRSFV